MRERERSSTRPTPTDVMSVVVFGNYFFQEEGKQRERDPQQCDKVQNKCIANMWGEANYSSGGSPTEGGSEESRGGFSHGTNLVVQITYEHRRAVVRISFLRAPNSNSRTSLERDGEERPLDPTSKQRRRGTKPFSLAKPRRWEYFVSFLEWAFSKLSSKGTVNSRRKIFESAKTTMSGLSD